MAVPKRKTSKARRDKRRANYKASAPSVTECPQCGTMRLSHRVCRECGYYNKREVIAK